ncbi:MULTISPECIES: FadR/GntR family transcriptional regulator [Rhodomicrobium]|uniref:FadR/GntR family transcriptional regulator n=1 Tax=Rhodomicrobium TaxID=1068 RepID=UPI000F747841|nr:MULTISPECIES: FadR/GntR family transcriptional regulator [Rhodomicrobium]
MPFQPVQNQRLYQKVAEQIGLLIAAGEFEFGDRLPPERELARKLGVSRPVLREALVTLEMSGSVEVRGGSGCFVIATPETLPPPLADGGPSPFEVIHARRIVETEIAGLAAENAAPEEVAGLEETLAMMRADIASGRDTRDTDSLFHIRLAEAAGNSVLASIVGDLWGHMTAPVFNRLGANSGLPDTDRMTVSEHVRIVEAVAARDGQAAREAMAAHLDRVRDTLLEGASGKHPAET